ATSCLTCKNSITSSPPPTCAPKCTNCANGQCIDGVCVCNSGYGGVNCSSVICPENCLKCSTPYLCSSCLPRTFGATCSFTCIPNCLTCSDDKTCTKCDAGFTGQTCSTGPNYFRSTITTTAGIDGVLPYRIRYFESNGFFSIGNRRDVIFGFTLPTQSAAASSTLLFNNATFAPFTSLSSSSTLFMATTSVPGILIITPQSPYVSFPISPTMIYNTGINETFIDVYTNNYFSFFLTKEGNVRSFGELSVAGCCPSGFFGVYKTNFTKLAIPHKISYLSCHSRYLCFAYSRESRRLYGWGPISDSYYGTNTGLCQYSPLELDITTFGSEILLSITFAQYFVLYLMESGKIFYTGYWGSLLPRVSYPTLLSTSFIGTSERITRITFIQNYNSLLFTAYNGNNYILGDFYKFPYPGTNSPTTGTIWGGGGGKQVIGNIIYSPTMCNGLFDSDPNVCSGNGICEEMDMCYCKTGYAGINCEVPICGGKRADVASVCSGIGSCLSPNNCSCPNGYNGTNCEISSVSNCLPSASNCQSCKSGFYDTSKLCRLKCLVNCEVCSSSETCNKCLDGLKGQYCNEKVCKVSNCATCSTSTGDCLECNEGYYGSYCNITCPSNCKSCSSEVSCSTCRSGWTGPTCQIPVCNENCITCSSPNQCSKCFNGLYGSDCSNTCPSTCESCINSTSCLTCPPYSSGSMCEIQTENCLSFINSPPKVSVTNLGSSKIMYTISVSNILSRSTNMTRLSFSEISTCERNVTDLVTNSTSQLTCETQYSISTSISDLISDSRVTQQLDSSGVVLTLTIELKLNIVPFGVGLKRLVNSIA
ncbi:predicted protein, partial [Naegleria gruberi]